MDNVWNEYFLLSYLKESELEEKYRAEWYTHMIVNGYEVRWPKGKDFTAALEDHTAEFFVPGGTWEPLGDEKPEY